MPPVTAVMPALTKYPFATLAATFPIISIVDGAERPPRPLAVPITWLPPKPPLAGPPNAPNPVSKLKPEPVPVIAVPEPVIDLPEIVRNEPSMLVNVSFDIAS